MFPSNPPPVERRRTPRPRFRRGGIGSGPAARGVRRRGGQWQRTDHAVAPGQPQVLLDDAPAGLSAGLGTGDVEGKVAKAEQEAADKSAKGREAKVYLDTFYQELHLAREQRKANNREAAALKASSQEVVVQSDQLWERIMALIDFNFNCGNGTSDNERFRKAIFKARELRLA